MKKRLTALVLALCVPLLLLSCAGDAVEGGGEYLLYFPVERGADYGSAMGTQPYDGEVPTVQQLLQALFAGPAEDSLRSPFPRAVALLSVEHGEGRLLKLRLSEQYSGLSDIGRTLADASIVLTLCQLPDVERVEISSDGFWSSSPTVRTLSPAELELDTLLP